MLFTSSVPGNFVPRRIIRPLDPSVEMLIPLSYAIFCVHHCCQIYRHGQLFFFAVGNLSSWNPGDGTMGVCCYELKRCRSDWSRSFISVSSILCFSSQILFRKSFRKFLISREKFLTRNPFLPPPFSRLQKIKQSLPMRICPGYVY